MTYQIFSLVPRYDDRDAICVHVAHAQPNTYVTLACAAKIASVKMNEEGSETEFVAVPFGVSPFDRAAVVRLPAAAVDCDIPF